MTDFEPNNIDRYPHTHLVIPDTDVNLDETTDYIKPNPAQVIDIQSYLQKQTAESTCTDIVPETTAETGPPSKTLKEKRLESIFAVAIGSIITMSIIPATSHIDNPKIHEAANTGLLSLVGWGIFYAAIPYIQDSKLGKIISKIEKINKN